ncbi:MAG TPA: RibD family protein [Thermosynechococcaceae cyanobacterium]
MQRPHTTVILATSADGKIADVDRRAARFGSLQDKAHLERQIAQVDAVLFGAGTLRAYGTSLPITSPELLQQRQDKPPQPIHIVASASGAIDPQLRFFQQLVPRWLLTTQTGDQGWQGSTQFDRVLAAGTETLDWSIALTHLCNAGIKKLAVLGGGTLVASLLEVGAIDELWITICPLLLGGATAPTLVEGSGFPQTIAPRLQLLEVKTINQEVFLHYRVVPQDPETRDSDE